MVGGGQGLQDVRPRDARWRGKAGRHALCAFVGGAAEALYASKRWRAAGLPARGGRPASSRGSLSLPLPLAYRIVKHHSS